MNENANTGKIGRLPFEIREEVNRRLRDGQPAKKIIGWLHTLPEVLRVLDEYFGEEPISDQNVSTWRQTGYARWMARLAQVDRTRELASYAVQIAEKAGGSLADGAAQVISGNVLEVLEELDALRSSLGNTANGTDGANNAETTAARLAVATEAIQSLSLAVARLRRGDQNAEALRLARERLAQTEKSLELEREKFQRQTCELFMKWREDRRATEIADGPGTSEDKVEKLGKAMFGDLWA